MPTQLQLRRGTTAQTAIFTGAVGEVTVDTDLNTLVVHDGATQGGFTLPTSAQLDSVVQNAFVTISANGTSVVADSNADTLTISSADGVSIYADAASDTITINLTPTGITSGYYGGGANVAIFSVDNFGRITEVSNLAFSAGGTDFAFFTGATIAGGI